MTVSSKDFFIVKEMRDRKIYRLSNKNKPDISFPWDIQKNSLNLKDLSGIHYHSTLKNLFILSDESKSVVETTLRGVEMSRLELTERYYRVRKKIFLRQKVSQWMTMIHYTYAANLTFFISLRKPDRQKNKSNIGMLLFCFLKF